MIYSKIECETKNELLCINYSYIKKMNCLSIHSLINESNTIAIINPIKIIMTRVKRIVYSSQAKQN